MDLELKCGKQFRIYLDESYKAEKMANKTEQRWRYIELRGKYGYIYSYSHTEVAVAVIGSKRAKKVRLTYKWRIAQDSDDATVFVAPDSEIKDVCRIIKPFRQKNLSDKRKAELSEVLKSARAAIKDEPSKDK